MTEPRSRARSRAERPLWQCTVCGRAFANANQSHACGRYELEPHFAGKALHVRATFDAFVAAIASMGPAIVLPEKTRIAFQVRMSFAAVMPRREWLDGHLVLARRAEHPRFRAVQVISPRNVVHQFRLHDPAEIDPSFGELLREAYAVGDQKHLERG